MPLSPRQVVLYQNTKTEITILGSKCFFLIQLYDVPTPEIDTIREKMASIGLHLTRFPIVNWRKTSSPIFQAAKHLPVHISNYAVIGKNKLDSNTLPVLARILQQDRIVFIFGYQENLWFSSKRLLYSQEVKTDSSTAILKALNSHLQELSPLSLTLPVFQHLFSTLQLIFHKLK